MNSPIAVVKANRYAAALIWVKESFKHRALFIHGSSLSSDCERLTEEGFGL